MKDSEENTRYVNGKKIIFLTKMVDDGRQCRKCICYNETGIDCPTTGPNDDLVCDIVDQTGVWVEAEVEPSAKPLEASVGRKYDAGKPRYDLIPADALEEVAKVLTAGAVKYAPENWRYVEDPQNRYFSAAQRHMWATKRGEEMDVGTEEAPGTGCWHDACAIASLMFKLQLKIEAANKVK